MYIHHITLSTGHNARIARAKVADEVLAILAPWLDQIVNTGRVHPLPGADFSHYSAKADAEAGELIVTLYGPTGSHQHCQTAGGDIPLVTFGIAQNSQQGAALWAHLLDNFAHARDIQQPSVPWLAVVVHPSIVAHFDVLEWAADFEQCCAWAWITRHANL